MFRKPHSLSRHLVLATALALGASSVALADDNSMNPSIREFNNGDNRGNPNMTAQATESVSKRQKKDGQEVESKALPVNGRPLVTSPGHYDRSPPYFNQYPGQ
jgi:hypothetical protein